MLRSKEVSNNKRNNNNSFYYLFKELFVLSSLFNEREYEINNVNAEFFFSSPFGA